MWWLVFLAAVAAQDVCKIVTITETGTHHWSPDNWVVQPTGIQHKPSAHADNGQHGSTPIVNAASGSDSASGWNDWSSSVDPAWNDGSSSKTGWDNWNPTATGQGQPWGANSPTQAPWRSNLPFPNGNGGNGGNGNGGYRNGGWQSSSGYWSTFYTSTSTSSASTTTPPTVPSLTTINNPFRIRLVSGTGVIQKRRAIQKRDDQYVGFSGIYAQAVFRANAMIFTLIQSQLQTGGFYATASSNSSRLMESTSPAPLLWSANIAGELFYGNSNQFCVDSSGAIYLTVIPFCIPINLYIDQSPNTTTTSSPTSVSSMTSVTSTLTTTTTTIKFDPIPTPTGISCDIPYPPGNLIKDGDFNCLGQHPWTATGVVSFPINNLGPDGGNLIPGSGNPFILSQPIGQLDPTHRYKVTFYYSVNTTDCQIGAQIGISNPQWFNVQTALGLVQYSTTFLPGTGNDGMFSIKLVCPSQQNLDLANVRLIDLGVPSSSSTTSSSTSTTSTSSTLTTTSTSSTLTTTTTTTTTSSSTSAATTTGGTNNVIITNTSTNQTPNCPGLGLILNPILNICVSL